MRGKLRCCDYWSNIWEHNYWGKGRGVLGAGGREHGPAGLSSHIRRVVIVHNIITLSI